MVIVTEDLKLLIVRDGNVIPDQKSDYNTTRRTTQKTYGEIDVEVVSKVIKVYKIECKKCGVVWEATDFTLMIGDVQRHQWGCVYV